MKILITGASGLVGKRLTALLGDQGHEVVHLGRSRREGTTRSFTWDIEKGEIETGVFDGVDGIVHLAGAGVAESRWTKKRKQEILESRTKSTLLLCQELEKVEHQIQSVVAASAVGYYGWDTGDEVCYEGSNHGTGFLADVVIDWEKETSGFRDLGIKTTQLRIGIVLDKNGGALEKMVGPIKMGIGSPLGPGDQWMSWIHIDDLCRMIIHSLENHLDGAYNAVGPNPLTNKALTKAIAKALDKPLFMPNVPAFVLRIVLGEMASMVIGGNRASADKIKETGFEFQFPQLDEALKDIFS